MPKKRFLEHLGFKAFRIFAHEAQRVVFKHLKFFSTGRLGEAFTP
jgi:hypothetical protein